ELRLILDALDGKKMTIPAGKKNKESVKIRLRRNLRLRAAVLLGVNAGAGNTDISGLQFKHLDLTSRWLNYARPKTGIARRVPLWPVTVEAIEAAINARPAPKNNADADCVF